MAAISPTTRATIKAYLEVFIENLVKEYKGRVIPTLDTPAAYLEQRSSRGRLKPFHAAIVPAELMRINEFERGFSSSLGTTFEECARLIALEHHSEAHRSYDLTGEVSLAAINEIEHQVATFEHAATDKGQKPSLEQMIKATLDAHRKGDLEERTVRVDLYILPGTGQNSFLK